MPTLRNLAVLITLSIVCLAAAWFMPVGKGVLLVQEWGYWLMLLLSILSGYAMVRYYREQGKEALQRLGKRKLIGLAGAALVATFFLQAPVEKGFKVQMDESVLASTVQSMHLTRDAAYPLRVYEIRGTQERLNVWLDKRPLMLPFLGSLWADLFGFRPQVLVELNSVLVFGVALVVTLLGWLLGRWLGVAAALLLLTSYPLLVIHFNSGNMSVINMLGFSGLLLAAALHLRRPTVASQELLVFAALFLAWCRYESVLYCGAAGAVILWAWWRQQDRTVSRGLLLAPFFLVPWVWQQRMFIAVPANWEVEGVGSGDLNGGAFSVEYLFRNIPEWLYVAFNWSREIPNSPLLAVLGGVSLLFFLLLRCRIRNRETPSSLETVLFIFLPFVVLHLAVLLLYVWNPLVDIIWRIYLPVFFYLGLMAVWGITRIKQPRIAWGLIAGLVFYQLGYTWPLLHSKEYEVNSIGVKEFRQAGQFLESLPQGPVLFVSDCAPFFAIHRHSAIHTNWANEHAAKLENYLQSPEAPRVYYMQSMQIDPLTRAWVHNPRTSRLGEMFDKREIARYPYSESRMVVFWEITGLVEGYALPAPPSFSQEPENLRDYYYQWIFMLP